MKFIKKNPSASLQSLVKHYWYFEITDADIPYSQLLFPWGSFELIFILKGNVLMKYINGKKSFSQPKSFYSGQFTNPFELTFTEPCICMGASFYPWAGNSLYNIPSDEFTNQMVHIDAVEKDNSLFDELHATTGNKKMLFNILEKYLESKLCGCTYDAISGSIANQILKFPERRELNKYLSTIGLSRRRIEQRFLETIGLPMSLFLRKARFQRSIHLLDLRSSALNLTQLGLLSDFYDQAHFINEFKDFAGITPSQFIQQNSGLKDFIKSLVIS
jgi:AraC-like DNA-binding protein